MRRGEDPSYTRCPLFVVRDLVTAPGSPFTATERHVALCIADHMGSKDTAWPSMRRIADWTGLGETAVRRAIARLCRGADAVFVRELGGARPGSRYETTHYKLAEGIATRAPRVVSPSPSEAEGFARSGRGVRQARTEGLTERLNEGLTYGGTPSAPASTAIVHIPRIEAVKDPTWNQRASGAVIRRYGGTAPGGRITRAQRPLVAKHAEATVLDAWERYLDETPAEYISPEKFATTFGRYMPGGEALSPRQRTVGERAIEEADKFFDMVKG